MFRTEEEIYSKDFTLQLVETETWEIIHHETNGVIFADDSTWKPAMGTGPGWSYALHLADAMIQAAVVKS